MFYARVGWTLTREEEEILNCKGNLSWKGLKIVMRERFTKFEAENLHSSCSEKFLQKVEGNNFLDSNFFPFFFPIIRNEETKFSHFNNRSMISPSRHCYLVQIDSAVEGSREHAIFTPRFLLFIISVFLRVDGD